jgi:pimeloyl-ACP methyl ester carboxylesterase
VRRLLLIAATAAALLAPATAAGSVDLGPCPGVEIEGALCGSVAVPLDRAAPENGRTIPIGFELYRHSDESQPSLGTIVALQGGPGGSSTSLRDLFRFAFGSLLDRRDLLLVDVRGTGESGAIDCRDLQELFDDARLPDAVRACAAQLGDAADLYGVVDVADDLDAVRAALGIDRIDLYGVSYGTEIAEVYALRHGIHLRSLVLDSALGIVQRTDLFGFDREVGRASQHAVGLVCERSAMCSHNPGSAERRLAELATRLRHRPARGVARLFGFGLRVKVDEARLINVLQDGTGLLEIDGAGYALRRGDRAPLLRLGLESLFASIGGAPPEEFSVGDFFAAFCTDASFPWNASDSEAAREASWQAAFGELPEQTFAPFSVDAWRRAEVGLLLHGCVYWPAPRRALAPLVPPGATWPSVPVLVLAGDLDLRTPQASSEQVADLFPNGRLVRFANVAHGAIGSFCAIEIIDRFVAALDAGDTSCAGEPPPLYGYTTFPMLATAELHPVERRTGDESSVQDRRVAAAVLDTITDALTHGEGVGLRGGRALIIFGQDRLILHLHGAKFVKDVAVTGTLLLSLNDLSISGDVRVSGSGTALGRLRFDAGFGTGNHFSGEIGGRRIALFLPDVT